MIELKSFLQQLKAILGFCRPSEVQRKHTAEVLEWEGGRKGFRREYSPEQTCPHLQSLTPRACIHAWRVCFTGQPNSLLWTNEKKQNGRNKMRKGCKDRGENKTRSNFSKQRNFPVSVLRVFPLKRKDSSHSWNLWTRSSTTMREHP